MRLAPEQLSVIRECATEIFGAGTQVWLFGSRADDSKRGGDIDLLIVPEVLDSRERLLRKIRFHARLERQFGDRRVDVIVEAPGDDRPIVRVAHETGVRLQ